MKYEKLFQPFRLGRMELKNRIVMPAIGVAFANADGSVGQRMIDYLEERAKGGVGLIIVGLASVDFQRGRTGPFKLSIDDDRYIPGYAKLVETLHRHGVKVALQLHHGGGVALSSLTGFQPVAPSAVLCRPGGDLPKELTVSEIHALQERFIVAAERGAKAGFDGVEIHAAGGYLFAQFLSPAKNRRRDEYGGELANRARFLLEILAGIRVRAGADFPAWAKINGIEYGAANGFTTEEARQLAIMLEKARTPAIRVFCHGSKYPWVKTLEPEGSALHLAAAIKGVVSVPVIAVGRITPAVGEMALREGKADLVAFGRSLLVDPELPNKAASGRPEDIAPCITCLHCAQLTPNGETSCTVNPALGREAEFRIAKAGQPKKVLVIGGGPAGMEAARIAALRGHTVTLVDKGRELGGSMRLAWSVPRSRRIKDLALYLAGQVRKLGVHVQLGRTVTLSDIEALKPDAVVLATGFKISPVRRLLAMSIVFLSSLAFPEFAEKGVLLKSYTRRRQILGIQTPLLAAAKPNQDLLPLVRGRVPEVFLAGDCLEPAGIMEAVADGARIGRSL